MNTATAQIAANFPARNRRGIVTGFYVYNQLKGQQVAGPFPTAGEARHAITFAGESVICGPVFSDEGNLVIAN